MKLIYVHRISTNGVNQKISAQVKYLLEYGIDATIFFIPVIESNHFLERNQLLEKLFNFIHIILREYKINQNIRKLISISNPKDIIYLRILYPSPQLSMILRKKRQCKVIFEYQTIEPLEYKTKGKYLYLVMDFLFGDSLRKYSDAIVGVTNEITEYELKRCGNLKKPHITIGNGIDIASVPLRHLPRYFNDELHLICVANISRWHGLDRLINGIAAYSGNFRITLHIVGEGEEISNLHDLVENLNISEKIIFHGFLTGNILDRLFDKCHLGIGSLGIHRKGLSQTSELKIREYCARGLPFIIACDDPDFPNNFAFLLKCSSDETPININLLLDFVKEVYSDLGHPQKMRAFAQEYLNWSVKMNKLKGFLETITRSSLENNS